MDEEIRFCKDCLHFRPNPKIPDEKKYGKCVHPTLDRCVEYLVSGKESDILEEATFASTMRNNRCGPDGKLWEPMAVVDQPPTVSKLPWWKAWILRFAR